MTQYNHCQPSNADGTNFTNPSAANAPADTTVTVNNAAAGADNGLDDPRCWYNRPDGDGVTPLRRTMDALDARITEVDDVTVDGDTDTAKPLADMTDSDIERWLDNNCCTVTQADGGLDDSEMDTVNSALGFDVKIADEWLYDAIGVNDPEPLFESFIFDGEVSILFGNTNCGKSILAVQIADKVSRTGRRVAYFDFEMDMKEFQMRATDPTTGDLYGFSPNFYRVEVTDRFYEGLDRKNPFMILEKIERCGRVLQTDMVIIDNITYICDQCENPEIATDLVRCLKMMAKRNGWTMLLMGHTKKKQMSMDPLDADMLAGSKKLINFVQSAFAVGTSRIDPDVRYIKQIKVRKARMKYGENSVLVGRFGFDDGLLKFVYDGTTAREEDLLHKPRGGADTRFAESKQSQYADEVRRLHAQGMSLRKIAARLSISAATVHRILSDNDTDAA